MLQRIASGRRMRIRGRVRGEMVTGGQVGSWSFCEQPPVFRDKNGCPKGKAALFSGANPYFDTCQGLAGNPLQGAHRGIGGTRSSPCESNCLFLASGLYSDLPRNMGVRGNSIFGLPPKGLTANPVVYVFEDRNKLGSSSGQSTSGTLWFAEMVGLCLQGSRYVIFLWLFWLFLPAEGHSDEGMDE